MSTTDDEVVCDCCGRPIIMDDSNYKIHHTTGYKDDYLVEVLFDEPTTSWTPTNDELFTYVHKWLQSECYEFGESGYGHWMTWYYLSLIALGYEEKALKAYGKRGYDALNYFEQTVEEHADELMEMIVLLKLGKKNELPQLDK